jgi:hypothetical protein
MKMADGSQSIEPTKSPNRTAEAPDVYPPGTQMRLCTVAMALQGAAVLFNEIMDGSDTGCGVMATIDLVVAELTRINNEMEEFEPPSVLKQEVAHG